MTSETENFTIEEQHQNLRIDLVLNQEFSDITRSQFQKLITNGFVKVNNKIIKSSYKTQIGDAVQVSFPEPQSSELIPYDFPLDILFEDEHLLVINKPANFVVHPAYGHEQDTLVNALIHHYPNFQVGMNENRPGIVHRLDKDTSGALVVAKDHPTLLHLSQQFKEKTVHRVYWALCHGPFYINKKDPRHYYDKDNNSDQFTVNSYLARHPNDRKRFSSQPLNEDPRYQSGKLAITSFTHQGMLENGLVLFHCQLKTGRTHQIRIHISELGCPVIGDATYGAKRIKKTYGIKDLNRLGLHAAELGFIHPKTGEQMMFKTPSPDDLKLLFDKF
ncbi:MAG: RluA family pseudouridine synthase [Bdellovibrionaceae bacterium]|jgi:23S rRNA pseudouridine1911/1915/1917 synthase|nr:RluA family pseudouridine synthase [Pseudobdellovibrionaceae bacterium]